MKYDYSKKIEDHIVEELLKVNPDLYYLSLNNYFYSIAKDQILQEYITDSAEKYILKASRLPSGPVKKLKK